jgi:transposase
MKGSATKRIDVTLEELHQLRGRIGKSALDADDWPLVGALVEKLIDRTEARQRRLLEKIAAAEEESQAATGPAAAGDSAVDSDGSSDGLGSSDTVPSENGTEAECSMGGRAGGVAADDAEAKTKVPGHGRNGADAYTNAKHVFHKLLLGIIGTLCERCKIGRMTRYREKVTVRVVGQPLFGAEVHHAEQARCRNCGNIIRAAALTAVLEGVGSSYVTYDWSACAMLIVMHYFGGAPFKRLESLHEGWGVPLADANQWNIVDQSDDLLLPLYKAIERHGIEQAKNLRIDDTGSMVIETQRKIQAEIAALERVGESTRNVRTGINATGVYIETDDATVILFYTGRHHAGEIIDQLLVHRKNTTKRLVKVTDAASKNFDHAHQDKLIEATCNAHALLKFRAIKDKFSAEYAIVGEIYKKVFDHDDEAKARGMTPIERMHYHREHSKPLMQQLKAMCVDKIKSKLVEPNSPLWEPLSYIINQWSRLTKFYEEPGVPLDTNVLEQSLIIPVRYLAGSFNYQTDNGATVGDHHMSLIATARKNDVEPVAYLTDCLRNHEDLKKRPEYYLPWIYRQRLADKDISPDPARQDLD